MIVRERPHWARMLFVWRGSVLPLVLPQLALTTGFALLVTVVQGPMVGWDIGLDIVPFSLIGLAMAIFLGFRNSTSYARYWEARTLWGSVLNETRSLLRQGLTLSRDPGAARELGLLLCAFAHALRHQLRGSDPGPDLDRLLTPAARDTIASARFKPAMLLLAVGEWIRERRRRGDLESVVVPALELPLGRLSEALGGCERIASTPIPFAYAVLIHRTIYFYCLLLPFGLVRTLGNMTPVIVAFVAYTFLALEALVSELEDPFGRLSNDLALDAISSGIEATLREMLGEAPAPDRGVALDYVAT